MLAIASMQLTVAGAAPALAQPGPWYQVEVSIFAHEATDLSQERWDLQSERAREAGLGMQDAETLGSVEEFLLLREWSQSATEQAQGPREGPGSGLGSGSGPGSDRDPGSSGSPSGTGSLQNRSQTGTENSTGNNSLAGGSPDGPAGAPAQGPLLEPQAFDPTGIKLPDPARDAFIRLPTEDQNFRQTNQALEDSPDYRLLWHGAWRQPMEQAAQTGYLRIEAGPDQTGPELQGTIRAYFSPDTTRVVLDAELWRTVRLDGEWQRLPMEQERPMISNEFHYLDHPAIGIVAEVFRYERPVGLDTPLPDS